MYSQLNHIVAKQRSAELRRTAELERFAAAAHAQRPSVRNRNPTPRTSARVVGLMPRLGPKPRPAATNPADRCPAADGLQS